MRRPHHRNLQNNGIGVCPLAGAVTPARRHCRACESRRENIIMRSRHFHALAYRGGDEAISSSTTVMAENSKHRDIENRQKIKILTRKKKAMSRMTVPERNQLSIFGELRGLAAAVKSVAVGETRGSKNTSIIS